MVALTDQAIAKIKDLIMSGEFAADSKLPKEQELAQRLGLSRNSLREAVRALTLIGVLEPRVGDGTYVTSLEPELLLTGMGFVSDLVSGDTLLELHQVRRILEPVATGMAATRLTEEDFAALEVCLARMDAAETTQAFIAADEEFHRVIVAASGNSTLASLIQHLSGGTLRARLWRSVTRAGRGRDDEAAPPRHLRRAARARRRARERRRPHPPLRGRAVAQAHARGRRGRRRSDGGVLRGLGTVHGGRGRGAPARAGRGPPRRRVLRRLRHGPPHRARPHGPPGARAAGHRARDVGHGCRARPGRRRLRVGEHVVVRPLDTRGETAADKGFSHICRDLKFLGIDTPGAFQQLVDGARVHAPQAAAGPSTCDWPRSSSRWRSPATTSAAARSPPASPSS